MEKARRSLNVRFYRLGRHSGAVCRAVGCPREGWTESWRGTFMGEFCLFFPCLQRFTLALLTHTKKTCILGSLVTKLSRYFASLEERALHELSVVWPPTCPGRLLKAFCNYTESKGRSVLLFYYCFNLKG